MVSRRAVERLLHCGDRHLVTRGDKTAIIWAKDEAGEYERISYRQL